MPGVPGIQIGRNNDLTWGLTAALTDVSDLFRETLNKDKTKYKVDGEWRDLKIIKYKIQVGSEQ